MVGKEEEEEEEEKEIPFSELDELTRRARIIITFPVFSLNVIKMFRLLRDDTLFDVVDH